jgi:hypothetical protein
VCRCLLLLLLLLLQNAHVALREKLCYLPNRVTHWFKTGKVRCSCRKLPAQIIYFAARAAGTVHSAGSVVAPGACLHDASSVSCSMSSVFPNAP